MSCKRIILMYITEVSGHHSATLAIEKALKIISPGTEVLNINAFNYTNPISEKIVNRIYMGIIKRTPRIWDYLYDNPKIVKNIEKIKENIHKYNCPKLNNLFERFKPDAVVCTQAFPCGMVADYKKTYHSSIPLLAVLTDYIPHSYWIYEKVNYYVVPAEDIKLRLTKKAVASDKIKVLGIPFDPDFNSEVSQEDILRKLELKPNIPTLLIMGGGQGLGPIKTIVKSLEKSRLDLQEIVVSGTNKKLFSSLKRQIKRYKNKIAAFSYVDNINELMSVSDVIITKPGGITTAEALAKKLPMIIVRPIPGQENNNTRYLTESGAAIKIDKPENISHAVEELLTNPQKIQYMRTAAASMSKPDASLDIARMLLNL